MYGCVNVFPPFGVGSDLRHSNAGEGSWTAREARRVLSHHKTCAFHVLVPVIDTSLPTPESQSMNSIKGTEFFQ